MIGTLPPDYLPTVRKAIEAAHGHALRTLNGRVVSIEGAPAPKNAAIVEWDSVDDALAFYKSKAWTELVPQREKVQKTIQRYVVEVEKYAVLGPSRRGSGAGEAGSSAPPG
jgi:uncharacterized protein (DUF1330 family)